MTPLCESLAVDDRVLITVSEAARRLNTYPNAINRWIAKGELEAFRVEGRTNDAHSEARPR